MKKFRFYAFAIAICITFSSCVYSLFPIYTLETIKYSSDILGNWSNGSSTILIENDSLSYGITVKDKKFNGDISLTEKSSEGEEITQQDLAKNGYKFTITEDNQTTLYKAYLVKISNDYYLDFSPYPINGKLGIKEIDPLNDNLYPVHTFMKVDFSEKSLSLIQFNLDKLNKMFMKNLIRLRHEKISGFPFSDTESADIMITAKPEEIQKFIANYSKNPEVFEKPQVYAKL